MKQMINNIIKAGLIILLIMTYFGTAVHVKGASNNKLISLKYDDRYTFKHEVEKIYTINVSSKYVGTSIDDTNVIKICYPDKRKIVASGCGRAIVELKNGKRKLIEVKPAPISLVLLIGQSNMEGSPSDVTQMDIYKEQYIFNKEGQVYNTYGPSNRWHAIRNGLFPKNADTLNINNASMFIPSSLADNMGYTDWRRTNNLTDAESAIGKLGMDGAVASKWQEMTGEKIWLVNASHSGSSIDTWNPKEKDNNYWEAVNLYKECEKLLNKEIEAGHYKLKHKGYFWMQGEADYKMPAMEYLKKFMNMHKSLKKELAGDSSRKYKFVDKNIGFAGIIMVRANNAPMGLDDLEMTGPRKALYYVCQSSKKTYKNVFLVSQLSEVFSTDEGVRDYYINKYGSQEEYIRQNRMKSNDVKMPDKLSDLHSTVHYSQLAYNELGFDAVENLCYAKGYAKAPEVPVEIMLVGSDGYNEINYLSAYSQDNTVIAKVFPTWKNKSISVESDNPDVRYKKWEIDILTGMYKASVNFYVGEYNKQLYLG